MKKQFCHNILLTGAGFTKNFGGLLAKEMWSKIFNNPKLHSQLKPLLLNDFDYESIYHKVISGEYTVEEKSSINDVIFDAYKVLDDICREWTFRNDAQYPVNIYGVNKFIEFFSGGRAEPGLFFTLNQDLFVERQFNSIEKSLIHPGIQKIPDAHKTINRLALEKQDFISLPTQIHIENNKTNQIYGNELHYVKLHGSFGWSSSDGTNGYVIGKNKEKQLADEPLLSWYFKLFVNALSAPGRNLLIIGYGFRDDHINEVIADSVNKYGLKLYVISPSDQANFISGLTAFKSGKSILKGLAGYFPYSLLEIFPNDQSESHAWREINGHFLQ